MAVIQGSENVFEDLGFDTEEAANLKVRADLMLKLRQYILDCGWTQEQAADFFGETQPRMSNLMNGEISRFSKETFFSGEMGTPMLPTELEEANFQELRDSNPGKRLKMVESSRGIIP